jgi:hypothetical protein
MRARKKMELSQMKIRKKEKIEEPTIKWDKFNWEKSNNWNKIIFVVKYIFTWVCCDASIFFKNI